MNIWKVGSLHPNSVVEHMADVLMNGTSAKWMDYIGSSSAIDAAMPVQLTALELLVLLSFSGTKVRSNQHQSLGDNAMA